MQQSYAILSPSNPIPNQISPSLSSTSIHQMPVQLQSYIPNSLRRNRLTAYETDLDSVYSLYMDTLKSVMVQQLSINMFSEMWCSQHMQYIYQCLSEEESEDEFAQMAYEAIMKKYLLYKVKQQQIFAIFALYFMYYASEHKIRISISPLYLHEIGNLVQQNRNDKNSHYMKIAYQLFQKCFSICTKVGLRNPIVKYNGEPPRKPLIVSVDPIEYINKIEPQFKANHNMDMEIDININNQNVDGLSLKQSLAAYDKLKREVLKDSKQKLVVDVYFANRVQKLIKNYKEYASTVDYIRKKQDDNE